MHHCGNDPHMGMDRARQCRVRTGVGQTMRAVDGTARRLILIMALLLTLLLLTIEGSAALRYGQDTSLSRVDASFTGSVSYEAVGCAVAILGDINGDGFDDIATATQDNAVHGSVTGRIWIFLGKASGWSRDVAMSSADASLASGDTDGKWGQAIAPVGDVNGDGLDDFVVGISTNNEMGAYAGKVYLFLGRQTGWRLGMDLADADASFRGEREQEGAGRYVSGAGDVNGDGYDDFLIGAPSNDETNDLAGKCYLILGRASPWSRDVHLSKANASFRGERYDSELGPVAAAGDVNGDGYDDFLLLAPPDKETDGDMGQVYLILGKATGWARNVSAGAADASFHGEGAMGYESTGLAGGVDVNGDGYDDILVGSQGYDEPSGSDNGKVYIVFGRNAGWRIDMDLEDADASLLSHRNLLEAGEVLCAAGDVNGDGLGDFLVSSDIFWDGNVSVVLGARTGWRKDMNLSDCAASFVGEGIDSRAGRAIGGGGDIDGDGFDDIVIGAPVWRSVGNPGGKAYAVFVDRNVHPSSVTGVELYHDAALTDLASWAHVGDQVHVRLVGTGGNASRPDVTEVVVSSDLSLPGGFRARLYETGDDTHVYAGNFTIKDRTHEGHRWLRAKVGETVTVRSVRAPSRSASLVVTEPVVIESKLATIYVDEDVPFERAFRTSGGSVAAWEFSTNLTWTEWDAVNCTVRGTPSNLHVGQGWLRVRASDAYGGSDEVNSTVVVRNAPPAVLGTDATVALEDTEYSSDYDSTDDGQGDIAWRIETDAAWLAMDPLDGTLHGVPANDDVGEVYVVVTVDDGNGGTGVRGFTLTVMNANDAPAIMTDALPPAVEDSPYELALEGSDPDAGDSLLWTIETDVAWLGLGSASGVLSGTPGDRDVGMWDVTVTLRDAQGANATHVFTLEVINVNDPPAILGEDAPVATEDEAYIVTYSATDPDAGDTLAWSYASDASWLSFDTSTGVLSGLPTNEHVGEWSVNITLTDALGERCSRDLTVTVVNTNDAPRIVGDAPPASAAVGVPYQCPVAAVDDDVGDELTFSLDTHPPGMLIDPGTGLIAWTPGSAQEGVHPVIVLVTDGEAVARLEFNITVPHVNVAPTITSPLPSPDVTVGRAFSHQVVATDPEEQQSLAFELADAPTGMAINASGGLISWTPGKSDLGTHIVRVRVGDGKGGWAEQSFNLTVVPAADGDGDATVMDGAALPLILLVIAINVAVATVLYVRSRRGREAAP